jgi:rRNA maturation protein Nop10
MDKLKGTVQPKSGSEGPEAEYKYNPILSLTSVLIGGGWSMPRPGRFTPGEGTRYPLYRRLGGPHGRCGHVRKISPPPGFDPQAEY